MTRPSTAHRAERPFRALGAVLLLASLVALTAGCGDDGDAGDDTSDTSDALPQSAEIVATDYAFDALPPRIGTDTTLTMRNDSDVEVHELVAFALPDDIDGTAEEILARPEDELAFMDGPPALVIVAGPGEEPFVPVGDGRLPDVGRYLLFCAIPTSADPAEYLDAAANADADGPPDVAGGPPHFVHGMATTVEVVTP